MIVLRKVLFSFLWAGVFLGGAVVLIVFFLLSISVEGQETAKVLPRGIFRARVVGVFTDEVKEKYNALGFLQGYAHALNRSVTIQDLTAREPALKSLTDVLNGLEPGLAQQLYGTNFYADFSTQVQTYLPALEYGLSDRLSVGVRMPIIRRDVRTSFRAETVNNAETIQKKVGDLSPDLSAGISKFAATQLDTEFFQKNVFTSKGYDVPGNFTKTELGDVEFGAKYNFFKTTHVYFTALLGGRAPLGSTSSLTNRFDSGTGKGCWATAVQLFQEWEVFPSLVVSSAQKVIHNFSDTRKRAVPKSATDSLPSALPADGQIQDVTRRQPLEVETEVSASFYPWSPAVKFWGAYQVSGKGRDRYEGPGDLYYSGLSDGSDYLKHAAEGGFGYSTVPAFRSKRFAIPMEVQALYNTTLGGRNVPLASYGRLDLMIYF